MAFLCRLVPASAEDVTLQPVKLPNQARGIILKAQRKASGIGMVYVCNSGQRLDSVEQELARYAMEGYVVLGMDYPSDKSEETVIAAVEVLLAYPGVKRGRIGVLGRGVGGRVALIAATMSPKIGAVSSVSAGTTQWIIDNAGKIKARVLIQEPRHGRGSGGTSALSSALKKTGNRAALVFYDAESETHGNTHRLFSKYLP